MIGHELAIEQFEMPDAKASDEPCQRDLGGIGTGAEHRFAEEGAAQADAVKPAHQLPVLPALDRMGLPSGVEPERGALDIGVDPCLGAVGAGADYLGKGSVASDGK